MKRRGDLVNQIADDISARCQADQFCRASASN
jgi:hypothetical protein